MTESKQGSGKRQLQERNFEIVVNHITINAFALERHHLVLCVVAALTI